MLSRYIFDIPLKEWFGPTWEFIKSKCITATYKNITAEELNNKLNSGWSFTVIDLRAENIFTDYGHIQGAINYPMSSFMQNSHTVPQEKPIVLACYLGLYAQAAAKKLSKSGYADVYRLEGGMESWLMSDFPVIKKD